MAGADEAAAHRRRDRGRGLGAATGLAARGRGSYVDYTAAAARASPMRQVARVLLAALPPAQRSRARLMMIAGFFLQRDLLHLRAGADALLRRGRGQGGARPSSRSRSGNVLGPLLLGPLFDSVGRRRMIALTYSNT